MRVLFLTGEFPTMQGGVGDCTNEIARALAARGAQVGVLTSTRARQPAIQSPQLEIFPLIEKWNWSSLRVIRDTLRDFSPDLVHIQFQTAAFAMHPAIYLLPRSLSLFRERVGVRVVVTFHDLRVPYLFPKAGRIREWITRFFARACDAVIATNEEDYFSLSALRLKLLTIIPIGSNISTTPPRDYHRAAWRAQLGIADNEALLCYFGFLNESKGGETLIRALAQIPRAKLLMIGGQTGASDPTNAAYLARVKKEIRDLKLEDRVMWTDYTPPEIVTANFFAADICVLPYRDGASYRRGTLMAALAHGCAIVTTKVPSPKSQVQSQLPKLHDGENCLLAPPDDPRALANAIQRAVASPELRGRIGAGARAVAQHFSWDKIARQHLELYEQIVN